MEKTGESFPRQIKAIWQTEFCKLIQLPLALLLNQRFSSLASYAWQLKYLLTASYNFTTRSKFLSVDIILICSGTMNTFQKCCVNEAKKEGNPCCVKFRQ